MTEFEMASLANDLVTTGTTMITTYFSVVSGFVVTGYIAAHRLSRPMVVVAVGLFVAWSLSIGGQISIVMRNYYGMLAKIRDAATGDEFSWYAPEVAPRWINDLRPDMIFASLIVVALAAIYFFFHCRRVNSKAELEAAKV